MKFLIWQTAFLGDVVLATPLVRTLRENYPESKIAFVGRPFISELFRGWKNLELLPYSKRLSESLPLLKKIKNYDVAIVPHRSLRTAIFMLLSGIPKRIGFDKSEFRWAYTETVKHRWDLHEVDRNLELLKSVGIKRFIRETYLPLSSEEKTKTLERFRLREGEYIVVNPFSNFPLKQWGLENWAKFMKKLKDRTLVVTGLPSDRDKVGELQKHVRFIDLVGKTSLRELMAVIGGSKLVVSNDSSPVHIANALGVPALTVYTATSSKYGFYPLIGDYLDNPAPCSPCSPNPKKCRSGTYECLRLPSPDSVLKAVEKLLKI